MKRITGHLEKKNGKYYAVINLYVEGKRKPKWINLDLEVKKGNKRKADARLAEVLEKYNQNRSYLVEAMNPKEREAYRISNLSILEFLAEWLEGHKLSIASLTYANYQGYLNGRIKEYFSQNNIKVCDVTEETITGFYNFLHDKNLSNNSIIRYHSFMHVAFASLIPKKVLVCNPVGLVDKPKPEKPRVNYYNKRELIKLLEVSKNTDQYLIVLMAVFYGLRRSEIIGIKWSAIDFSDEGTITISHTVTQKNGELFKADVNKNDSSYRTMPLLPNVREALIREKENQQRMKGLFNSGYCLEDSEYVFVDALGHLIKPDDATNHFSSFIEKNMDKRITLHGLRHSCATCMLTSKTPMKNIQVWLGHSDMGTTANTYSHVDSHSMDEMAKTIYDVLNVAEK